MLTQISTKISVALVTGVAVASIACSSKDKKYSPGTVNPVGANVVPAEESSPAPAMGAAPAAAVAPAEPLPPLTPEEIGPTINYTVKKGDSLWLIAKDHQSSISRLKRVNQLASDKLQIGQVLRIPSGANQSETAPAATPPTPAPTSGAPMAEPKTTAPTSGTPTTEPNTPPAAPPTSKFKRPPTSADPATSGSVNPIAPKPVGGLKITD